VTGGSRTRGFLFADLRGYTDFVERRGDHAAAELIDRYRQLVRATIAQFGGAEIKTEGDSFFVVFDSASSAVECGLAITTAAADASTEGRHERIAVGVGVHAGETVETPEGYVGSAVNIAARVCAQARAGEVVVTETVRLLTRTFLAVAFVPLGKRPLKGVQEPVPLFRVQRTGLDAEPLTARGIGGLRSRSSRVGIGAVAVIAAVAFGGIAFAALSLVRTGVGGPQSSAETGMVPDLKEVVTYKADATRRGQQPGPGPIAAPVVAWQQHVGSTVDGSPIIVGGAVIVATDLGLSAWDARTGALRWRYPGAFRGTPSASTDGLVFATDEDGVFHGVDATEGIRRWSVQGRDFSTDVRSIVVDGLVYTGSRDGWAYGLEPATGDIVWQWHAPAEVTDITVANGTAYVSVKDGRLYAIALIDKRERWHVPSTSTGIRISIPMIEGSSIYLGSSSNEIASPGEAVFYSIDDGTGRVVGRWISPSGTQTSSAAERDGIVYTATQDDGLFALRGPDLQQLLWHADAPTVYTGLALVGDVLYLAGYDGRLLAYRASDGLKLWEVPIAKETHNTSPVVSGGMLFQADETGMLRAYVEARLAAILPSAAPSPVASPTPEPAALPDPFTIVRTIPWSKLGLGTVLEDGMALGPDGFVYVLDTEPEVAVIDPKSGTVVRRWGRQGTGRSEFDLTRPDVENEGYGGISIGPDGLVYVGDGSNHRVQVFTSGGRFVREFDGGGAIGNIGEIEVGDDGGVYVLSGYGVIDKFSPTGRLLWSAGGPDASDPDLRRGYLHGLTLRLDGKLIVSCEECQHLILVNPATGKVVGHVGDASDFSGLLSIDPAGNLYLSPFGSGTIVLYSPNGTPIAQSPDLGFYVPPRFGRGGEGYVFDEDGLVTFRVTLPRR
jgi:class 3 adenylate cyclase/outer membrane protein assembly factor BamB